MVVAFAVLLICQLAGEILARGAGLPVPGPVLGAALLFLVLLSRDRLTGLLPREICDGTLDATGRGLLANLSLLFVPAGVGVVQRIDVISKYGIGLVVALVVSTVLALAVTALVFQWVAHLVGDDGEETGGSDAA